MHPALTLCTYDSAGKLAIRWRNANYLQSPNSHLIPKMSQPDYLGAKNPRLVAYLPHRPEDLNKLVHSPDAGLLMERNSNHWRKIVTILAKIVSPREEWREFRDQRLFQHTALCFAPELVSATTWHWIGGKDNLARFQIDGLNTVHLESTPEVALDIEKQILITPYPDYRQLNNVTINQIRAALDGTGFYTAD